MAELLIVVAIIAVLVVIAISAFSLQLEKAREADDANSIRDAYAELAYTVNLYPELQVASIAPNGEQYPSIYYPYIRMEQKKSGWQNEQIRDSLVELFKSFDIIENTIDDVKDRSYALISFCPGDSSHQDIWRLWFEGGYENDGILAFENYDYDTGVFNGYEVDYLQPLDETQMAEATDLGVGVDEIGYNVDTGKPTINHVYVEKNKVYKDSKGNYFINQEYGNEGDTAWFQYTTDGKWIQIMNTNPKG